MHRLSCISWRSLLIHLISASFLCLYCCYGYILGIHCERNLNSLPLNTLRRVSSQFRNKPSCVLNKALYANSIGVNNEIINFKQENNMESSDLELTSRLRLLVNKRVTLSSNEKISIAEEFSNNFHSMCDINFIDCLHYLYQLKCIVNPRLKYQLLKKINTDLVEYFKVNDGDLTKSNVYRLMGVMLKLGVKWIDISPFFQSLYLDSIVSIHSSIIKSISTSIAIPELNKTRKFIDTAEVSRYLYTLGQLQFSKEFFPAGNVLNASSTDNLNISIFSNVSAAFDDVSIKNIVSDTSSPKYVQLIMEVLTACVKFMNAAELSFTLNGLSKIGIVWTDCPDQVWHAFNEAIFNTSSSIKVTELCSIFLSLANMKVSWASLHITTRESLVQNILVKVEEMPTREFTSIIWSLGKLHMPTYGNEYFLNTLLNQMGNHVEKFTEFDLESTMVGLGLLQVRIALLSLISLIT